MENSDEAWVMVDVDDSEEDLYSLEDDEQQSPPPLPPPPPPPPPARSPSGFFYHTPAGKVSYAAFDARSSSGHPIPAPDSYIFSKDFVVLASTRGLVCLREDSTGLYHIANPFTTEHVPLPPPNRKHDLVMDPAVVITADQTCPDHYYVVCAFSIGEGIFGIETFSSRAWGWRVSDDIADVQLVWPESGVGALGRAFWKSSSVKPRVESILCYDPETGHRDMIAAPQAVKRLPVWQLGEMEGKLCVTCMDDRVEEVEVLYLDEAAVVYLAEYHDAGKRDTLEVPWDLAGQIDGCKLRDDDGAGVGLLSAQRRKEGVRLLRSQRRKEVVMLDTVTEKVLAMDLEGHPTRTIGPFPGCSAAEFIPFVSSGAEVFDSN